MASYDGAVAAIQQRLSDNWSSAPVSFQNGQPAAGYEGNWPPADNSPFVYLEVINTVSGPRACGSPGNAIWLYEGLIHAHVFVPINGGDALAQQYARAIGDVFRNQRFYNSAPPNFVWTKSPRTDGGASSDQYASYWCVTCTIDFEFYLQA